MMHEVKRVVAITGAAGAVGTFLRDGLRDDHQLICIDQAEPRRADPAESWHNVDILDLDALVAAVAGADAVIHLAAASRTWSAWGDVKDLNFSGVYNALEASVRSKVRRFVFASTGHVVGLYGDAPARSIRPTDPCRPDSLYAASKVFGEALCRLYAEQSHLKISCLRLGWVLDKPDEGHARHVWLSPRDLVHLVECCLARGPKFGVYFGISDNKDSPWDNTAAYRDLGYQPRDDAATLLPGPDDQ